MSGGGGGGGADELSSAHVSGHTPAQLHLLWGPCPCGHALPALHLRAGPKNNLSSPLEHLVDELD